MQRQRNLEAASTTVQLQLLYLGAGYGNGFLGVVPAAEVKTSQDEAWLQKHGPVCE